LWWIPIGTVVYLAAWFVTSQVIGTALQTGFVVFGASGALIYQFFIGGLLWMLVERADESPVR
jgi:hypothetical protein